MELDKLVKISKSIIFHAFDEYAIHLAYEIGNVGVVASGGKDSTVMLSLVMDVVRECGFKQPKVLFCDPVPFEENREFCKRLAKHFGLWNYEFYEDYSNKYLEEVKVGVDKVRCCWYLKIKALEDFILNNDIKALLVGIRWDEHPARSNEHYFRRMGTHWRVHPMLHWRWVDVWEYIKREGLPVNPLYFKGYLSLGCKPCTTVVRPEGFKSVDEIISFIKSGKVKERSGRDIDKERVMERLRRLGYF